MVIAVFVVAVCWSLAYSDSEWHSALGATAVVVVGFGGLAWGSHHLNGS